MSIITDGLLTDRNVISIDTLIMSAIFLSHVLVEQQQGALSLKLLEWLQTIFPQSTNIICQVICLNSLFMYNPHSLFLMVVMYRLLLHIMLSAPTKVHRYFDLFI